MIVSRRTLAESNTSLAGVAFVVFLARSRAPIAAFSEGRLPLRLARRSDLDSIAQTQDGDKRAVRCRPRGGHESSGSWERYKRCALGVCFDTMWEILTAVCISIDRFLQDTATNICLHFDLIGAPRHLALVYRCRASSEDAESQYQTKIWVCIL